MSFWIFNKILSTTLQISRREDDEMMLEEISKILMLKLFTCSERQISERILKWLSSRQQLDKFKSSQSL